MRDIAMLIVTIVIFLALAAGLLLMPGSISGTDVMTRYQDVCLQTLDKTEQDCQSITARVTHRHYYDITTCHNNDSYEQCLTDRRIHPRQIRED